MNASNQTNFWLRFSIFNLFIVAVLGTLMRYKIAYSLPWLDQKHLQEAHSHFAFYGWVSQILYVLLVEYLRPRVKLLKLRKYQVVLGVNAFGALLMIPTFLYGGYYSLSIIASSICLFSGMVILGFLVWDLRSFKDILARWFLAGLSLAAFSSLGVFTLSYIRASGLNDQNLYLASTYFYLHFQYNGCFILMAIGFFIDHLRKIGVDLTSREHNVIFYTMLFGAIVGYGLSVLWLELPLWVYGLIVVSAVVQSYGAVRLFQWVRKNWSPIVLNFSSLQRFVLFYVAFAFVVKMALQLFSVVPAISQFAFGFRNVVIAYLHLVLLMLLTVFLVNQILALNQFQMTKWVKFFLKSVLLFIFLNEAVLGLMGLLSIKYIAIPYTAQALLLISIGIALSVLGLFLSLKVKNKVL